MAARTHFSGQNTQHKKSGSSQPHATWTKINSRCCPMKKNKYVLTLTIKNPSLEDGGMYRCNAFNQFGDSNANIDLNFESEFRSEREKGEGTNLTEVTTGWPIFSDSWVGLTLICVVPLSCLAVQPLLPTSHQPKQNQAEGGTARI